MGLPVLICDDSGMARKQMLRALPEGFEADITFAENGEEGLQKVRAGLADLLFLDLNMPVMDGYAVLEAIQREQLNAMVIVVSGDIQQDARSRVMQLGAMDFLQKPVNSEAISELMQRYGLWHAPISIARAQINAADALLVLAPALRDAYQELANVAMGQAGALLSRLLDVFIQLPVPKVALLEISELAMALSGVRDCERLSAVCQGFAGAGVAGEALVLFDDASFVDMATLMHYEGAVDDTAQLELLMDVSNSLIGAFLKGLSAQLDVTFSRGAPVVLGQHCSIDQLICQGERRWSKNMVIEINYRIDSHNIHCDLLLLFAGDSLASMHERVSCLID
jgi:chemotaxis protein CheY-P-specific phosphatase CheC/ActR/RegA family two-component response regulator